MSTLNIRFTLNDELYKDKIIIDYLKENLTDDCSNAALKEFLFLLATNQIKNKESNIKDDTINNLSMAINNISNIFSNNQGSISINTGNIINGNNNVVSEGNIIEENYINNEIIDDYSDVEEMLSTFDF